MLMNVCRITNWTWMALTCIWAILVAMLLRRNCVMITSKSRLLLPSMILSIAIAVVGVVALGILFVHELKYKIKMINLRKQVTYKPVSYRSKRKVFAIFFRRI